MGRLASVLFILLGGCNLLFRADPGGDDDGVIADAAPDAFVNPDQPMVKSIDVVSGQARVGGAPITIAASIQGRANELFACQFEEITGAELGAFIVPDCSRGLDANGRATVMADWRPMGFGRVTLRVRVAYTVAALDQGNVGDTSFPIVLDVGNYTLPVAATTLFSNTLYGFKTSFTKPGKIIALGMFLDDLPASAAAVQFGLYTANGDQPEALAQPAPNQMAITNRRVEVALERPVDQNDQLFVVLNLSTDVRITHRAQSTASPVTVQFTNDPIADFPNMPPQFPTSNINMLFGDFAVYATMEPPP